ncbi:MAG: hypothetical protein LC808_35815 [Actinobacteria bacterium]|nr:hypothetical protein [Actinomycetota bacterium]
MTAGSVFHHEFDGKRGDWRTMPLKFTVTGTIGGHWGDEPLGNGTDTFCLRVADFDFERGGLKNQRFTVRSIDPSTRDGRRLREGDLLLEKSGGGDLQPVGRVVRVDRSFDRPVVSSNFVARLRPSDGFESRYLCYLHKALYSRGLTRTAIKQTTGIQNLDVEHYLRTVWERALGL